MAAVIGPAGGLWHGMALRFEVLGWSGSGRAGRVGRAASHEFQSSSVSRPSGSRFIADCSDTLPWTTDPPEPSTLLNTSPRSDKVIARWLSRCYGNTYTMDWAWLSAIGLSRPDGRPRHRISG
jgi:hypothetical protein